MQVKMLLCCLLIWWSSENNDNNDDLEFSASSSKLDRWNKSVWFLERKNALQRMCHSLSTWFTWMRVLWFLAVVYSWSSRPRLLSVGRLFSRRVFTTVVATRHPSANRSLVLTKETVFSTALCVSWYIFVFNLRYTIEKSFVLEKYVSFCESREQRRKTSSHTRKQTPAAAINLVYWTRQTTGRVACKM